LTGRNADVPISRVYIRDRSSEQLGVVVTPHLPEVGATLRVDLDGGGIAIAVIESIKPSVGGYDAEVFCRPART
jgi:hypothetical protein